MYLPLALRRHEDIMEKIEERNGIIDTRMEKTEKNIEKLLEIMIDKKQ